ncbi:variant erythrocyte surface antigen-1 family protein [Babesia caballi]|uniref:Variant erythrocyte surface antigen-1 family protein n=1 Tax=Babesia caballi TaxID=5871 RepID=A0AAV4LW98_BABCB|nr:variant erythrocyte surface antigen-1 family protein [Babesia caballi]
MVGVERSDPNFSAEIGKVIQALDGSGSELIQNLAEGLQQFIGYDPQGGGKFVADKGIAVSNIPLERLRDAVLMFIAPFLGVLRHNHPELKHNAQLGNAVEACKKGVGCGKTAFEDALDTVATQLGQVSSGLSNGIKEVLDKVKDVSAIKSKDDVQQLADGFKTYFNNVLEKVADHKEVTKVNQAKGPIGNLKGHLEALVNKVGSQNGDHPINVGDSSSNGQRTGLKNSIDEIYKAKTGTLTLLREAFIKLSKQPEAYSLSAATHTATTAFVTVLQTGCTSYYKGATWDQVTSGEDPKKCAKIFLACLPLIFNGLSYFYWKCSHDKGWKDMTLGSPEPKAFIGLTSIGSNRVKSGRKGAEVLNKAFEKFKEFTSATSNTTSYADFLKTFRGNCVTTWQTSPTVTNENFLSGLYLCSTSYFSHQHQKKAATARPPSSIREMLYWIMGLTATPQFGDLLGHIDDVVGTNFSVAVSGSSKQNETLSADQVTSYILSTCYTSPSVLNIIQGSVPPNKSKDEPWLHELYSNSAFPFKYPSSGAALFYALSHYTYALQFQLGFLYQQCSQLYVNTCGWFMCNYGKGINQSPTIQIVESHICPVGCSNPNHKGDDITKHKTYCEHEGCGESNGKPSPLQAFLSDNLKGFSRGHPSGHSDHLAACSSHTCHVPMGFESHLRADGKYQGGHISLTLKGFCGSSNTPLCQLTETLLCLSKRTPRTLGDVFGFTWHLNGQLFKTERPTLIELSKKLINAIGDEPKNVPKFLLDLLMIKAAQSSLSGTSPTGLSLSLEAMAPAIPFLYQLFMVKEKYFLPTKLYDLNGSTHKSTHNDLHSISACANSSNDPCGQYLSPLCYSTGAMFAPKHASTYLSWVLKCSMNSNKLIVRRQVVVVSLNAK